jgi:catechol 2,3-dioxygenase-like lactoylglutathione lyase family enzyme
VALLVRDYDEAISWFARCLDFTLIEDSPRSAAKRWVLMSPSDRGTALLLARAATPEQKAAVGRQGGGRVMFFLRTDDFRRDYQRMSGAGVRFIEQPRDEEYGRVVVFEDLYGNKWDLIQSNQPD